ncbi:hypothetical protein P353_19815 [Comamonas testosteroni]|uniref:Uncharacterized protein n=1 Tax=Comamonas testosteroni TaxID=285 RepID=A0A096FBG5_COMTE|nr:hypothetical protein P353_19815 [Comamonas testosteroni]
MAGRLEQMRNGKVQRGPSAPPKWQNPALLLLDAVAFVQALLCQLGGSLLRGKPMLCGIGIECSGFLIRKIEGLPGGWWCWHCFSFRVTQPLLK